MSARRRFRAPTAAPGQLKAKWGTVEGLTDIQYCWGANGASKPDARILCAALEECDVYEGRTLAQELERRGYDLTTLVFSIKQAAP